MSEFSEADDGHERRSIRNISGFLRRSRTESSRSFGQMSQQEIEEGVNECIRLNTQNKITLKNAFNVKMIDLMAKMFREQRVVDFLMAGSSLGISAKVYSLRVDSLYNNVKKLSDKKHGTADKNIDEFDNEENSGRKSAPKHKKAKNNVKIFTTQEALNSPAKILNLEPQSVETTDCRTSDELYQASLPIYCGQSLVFAPYKSVILDRGEFNENTEMDDIIVKFEETDELEDCAIGLIFEEFNFFNWSPDQLENGMYSPMNIDQIPMDNDWENDPFVFDMNANSPEQFDAIERIEESRIMHKNREDENIVDIEDIDIIIQRFSSTIPCEYIKDFKILRRNNNFCFNFEKKHVAGQYCKRRKKRQLKMIFNDETSNDIEGKFSIGKLNSLRRETMKNWSKRKLIMARSFGIKNFLDIQLRDEPALLQRPNNLNFVDDYESENSSLESSFDINIDRTFEIEADPEENHGFVGENLIVMRELEPKTSIKYTRANKVDMRQLKKTIATTIDQSSADQNEPVSFGQIFENSNCEASFAVGFTSLLQLANERGLKLSQTENLDDIYVL